MKEKNTKQSAKEIMAIGLNADSGKDRADSGLTMDALKKKAFGYDFNEVVEDYSLDNGECTLVKKRVTVKNVPPDVSAIKLLLDFDGEKSNLDKLTDDELQAEHQRLLQIINEKGEN